MMAFRTLCVVFLLLAKGCHSQSDVCGIASLNNRIVGGLDADPGAWPWQVSLQACGSHFCGGSLINNGWVLSSAHCFGSYIASQVTVKLGLYTLEGINAYRESRWLSKVIIHPDYKKEQYDNDIALLKLSSVVSFNDYITPVCLAETGSTFHNGTLTWVTGWGKICDEVNLPYPGILQEVPVPIIGNKQCYCLYEKSKYEILNILLYKSYLVSITDNMLCAGLLEGGRDACQGDSGGPLVIKQDSRWIQVGIVSFGWGCAHPNSPGVYTRVSQYKNWINQEITTNQPGFIKYTSCGIDDDLGESCRGLPPGVVCGSVKLNNISGQAGSPLALAGTWPWMASLQLNGTHVCGGTLIAQQFVMSSAKCFSSSSNPSDWTVKLGRLNQNGSNPNEVSVNVTNITFSTSAGNNIAVLKLSTAPTLSDFIQPICVDFGNTNFSIGTQCWAAGWGSGGGAQQTLQQFNTTIVDCGNVSSSNSICIQAIPLEKTERGGPLMCQIGKTWIQAAVLTFTSNSTNSTTNSTNNSNSTTNSTNSSDVSPSSTNIQAFTTISNFSAFLNFTVCSYPPRSQHTSSASLGRETLSSLSSVLLTSFFALFQTF